MIRIWYDRLFVPLIRIKEFADRLQVVMEQQIGNAQFTIDEFASMMGLGRTVFIVRYVG